MFAGCVLKSMNTVNQIQHEKEPCIISIIVTFLNQIMKLDIFIVFLFSLLLSINWYQISSSEFFGKLNSLQVNFLFL